MNDKLKENIEKIKAQFEKLSPRLRKLILISSAGVIIFAVGLAVFLNQDSYVTLFTELTQTEAQEIMQKLESDGIVDYEYQNGTILVPEGMADNLRAQLAMDGYPNSGLTYTTFSDNVSMMTTDFENQTYKVYELQERIAATVRSFDNVKDAIVTISTVEEKKYVLDDSSGQKVTGVITVFMKDGGSPTAKQVEGMEHIMVRSIPNVEFENISIISGNGELLNKVEEENSASAANQIKIELEEYMDNSISEKVYNVLLPIFGYNNVTVSVKSTVDIDKKISEIMNYAPPVDGNDQGMYATYASAAEFSRDPDQIGGVPGTETNAEIPTYGNIQLDGSETHYSGQNSIDYYVNMLKEQVQTDAGYLADLTISVAINGEDLGNLTEGNLVSLVGNAAGIQVNLQEEKITVVATPFWQPEEEEEEEEEEVDTQWIIQATIAAGVFLLLMLLILMIRKRSKKKKQRKMEAEAAELAGMELPPVDNAKLEEEYLKRMLDKQQNEVEERLLSLSNEASNELKEKVRDISDENPEIAATLIKNWLNGGEGEEE